jgi:hypothetical protein
MATHLVRKGWATGADTGGAPNLTGQAGQTITVLDFCLVTTAGWTKVFTGTNTAAYKAPAGNQVCFSVDDTGTTLARVRPFEQSTGALTGYAQIPSEIIFPGGHYLWKSQSADATARPYLFIANSRSFYLFTYVNALFQMTAVGDGVSINAGDQGIHNSFFIGNNAAAPTASGVPFLLRGYTSWSTAVGGHYLFRSWTKFPGAVGSGKLPDILEHKDLGTDLGSNGRVYPCPVRGGLVLSRLYMYEMIFGPRVYLPGIVVPCHTRTALPVGTTFTVPANGGLLAGRSYEVLYGPNDGSCCIETSDTWDV